MLDENQVVERLCAYLEGEGYVIEQKLTTTQRGIDVIARDLGSGLKLLIEAKGETSSRVGSERHGKPYTPSQVYDRVAKGVYAAMANAVSAEEGEISCLAVPNTDIFRKYLWPLKRILERLGIPVLLVSEGGVTNYDSPIR